MNFERHIQYRLSQQVKFYSINAKDYHFQKIKESLILELDDYFFYSQPHFEDKFGNGRADFKIVTKRCPLGILIETKSQYMHGTADEKLISAKHRYLEQTLPTIILINDEFTCRINYVERIKPKNFNEKNVQIYTETQFFNNFLPRVIKK
jgi:hypothetical protein